MMGWGCVGHIWLIFALVWMIFFTLLLHRFGRPRKESEPLVVKRVEKKKKVERPNERTSRETKAEK
jgi:hypothetical protein